MRIVERFINGNWEKVEFKNIEKDDVFRMFEPDGEPVISIAGRQEFKAASNVFLGPDDIWAVETYD